MNNKLTVAILGFVMGASETLYKAHLLNDFIYNFYRWFFGPIIVLPIIVIVLFEEVCWQDRLKISVVTVAGWLLGNNILFFV